MDEKKKVKPLTPGMKMLLEGGGATAFYEKRVPLVMKTAPKLGNSGESDPKIAGADLVAVRPVPVLGQSQAAPAVDPAAQDVPVTKCPGPVALPDGRVLEPDDYIKLADLCEIMPYLMNAMAAAQKGPGAQVRVAGGIPGVQGVPTPGMFAGPGPLGPYAQGAAGGGFGGVGGGGAGPRGPAGPAGPAGPPGASLLLADLAAGVEKTDGDFTAGAGAFVPVPGTTVNFTTSVAGPVLVLVQAEMSYIHATAVPTNSQQGLRIDGTDYNLARLLMYSYTGDVGYVFVNQPQIFWMTLPAGAHTIDFLLKGMTAGEYLYGLGVPVCLSASPNSPFRMAVIHG